MLGHARGTANNGTLPTALVTLTDGLGVAIGSRPGTPHAVGFAIGVEATYTDTTRFDTAIAVSGSNVSLDAATALGNGDILVGGDRAPNDVARAHLLARLDSKGKLLWTSTSSQPDFLRVQQLVERSDGVLLGHGSVSLNANPAPFALALDPTGQQLWSRTYDKLFAKQLTSGGAGLAIAPDGAISVLVREAKSPGAMAIVRADSSGYASCKDAGSCAGKVLADCDDGKPCTLDGCDAAGGCVHVPTSGIACGVNQICAQGSCVNP